MKTTIKANRIKRAVMAALALGLAGGLHAWERSSLADDIAQEQRVAGADGPGMRMMSGMGAGLELADAKDYYEIKGGPGQPAGGSLRMLMAPMGSGVAPELESIAESLDYSAGRIIDWVMNYIDYEAYNGFKRGAKLTALERAGNSFDQAALTVELLRASGFDASYVFVNMVIPSSNAANWLGVASDQTFTYLVNSGADYVTRPATPDASLPLVYYIGSVEHIQVPQVWVRLMVNGTPAYFDPSYKPYAQAGGWAWATLSGYSAAAVYNAAGGTEGTETMNNASVVSKFVGNTAGKNSMRNLLSQYATNLAGAAKNDSALYSRSGREIMGGRWLDRSARFAGADGALALAFWDEIPSEYKTRLQVQVGNINHTFNTADIAGGKISVGFSGNNAVLYLDDSQVASESNGSGTTANVTLTYRYVVNAQKPNGLYVHSMPAAPIYRQGNYVINHGFEHVTGRVRERMRILAGLLEQGHAGDSRQVVTENLYIMGLNYLNELNNINEVASATLPVKYAVLHHAGVVGATNAPYVDLPICLNNVGIRQEGVTDPAVAVEAMNKTFMAGMYWGSMLEHSIIEQMLILDADPNNTHLNKGVSTTKFVQTYVENGHTIYAARTKAQWDGLRSTSGALQNYGGATGIINEGNAVFAANANKGLMLLPKNYNQSHQGYNGMGYISMRFPGSGPGATMGLTGVLGLLNGGSYVNPLPFTQSVSATINFFEKGTSAYEWAASMNLSISELSVYKPMSWDPVDLSSGAFYVSATDLTVGGGAAPYGLAFTRSYSTSMRSSDAAGLGKGWSHNYDMRLAYQHAGDLDLNRATAADVAPIMVAVAAIYEIYSSEPASSAKQYVVPALVSCWLGDQLINSRVAVQTADRSMTFAKLPDGSFAAPPGVTATLVKSGNTHTLKMRKGLEYVFNSDGRIATITDRNTNGQTARSMSFAYASGRLTQVTDAHGRSLGFSYTGNKLTRVTDNSTPGRYAGYSDTSGAFAFTDPEGKTTTYYKDAKNRITSIKDAKGRTTIANTYDNYDRIVAQHSFGDTQKEWRYAYAPGTTREQDPEGAVSIYYFDTKGRQLLHYDQLGNRTETAYDGMDRVVASATPARNAAYNGGELEVTYYFYNKSHEMTAVMDPAGRITTMEPSNDTSSTPRYDTSPGGLVVRTDYHADIHLPSKVTKPGGIEETFAYDSYGRLTQHHPAAYATGQQVTHAYTPATGVPTQVVTTYPGGGAETTKFDAIGNVIEKIDRAGVKTTYAYNKRRQVTSTVVWNGASPAQTSQIFYDDAGDVSHTIDPRGNRTDYTYTADGKLESVTDALGGTTLNTYDLRNQLEATANALGHRTVNTYDAAQRLVAVTNPLGHTAQISCDPLGNTLSATTPLSHVTRTEYDDSRFLPTTATDALGYDITYAYDQNGRQTAMTNRRGQTFTTAYHDALRKVTTSTPEGRETTVFANIRGLMDTTIRPSDKTVKNTAFDNEGRVLTQVIYAADGTTVLATTQMSYDAAGRLHQVTEAGRTTTRAYDALGRLASYSDGEGNTIRYGYDVASNLASLEYPGGLTVTYGYDALNRLQSVKDWNNRTTAYAYDAAGRLKTVSRPNGTVRSQTYDAAGQMRYVEERNAAGLLLWLRSLDYDKDGRITKMHTWPSSTPAGYIGANAADSATYDGDNRVGTWNLGAGGSVACQFDDDGNLLSGPAVNNPSSAGIDYQYDAHNRLTAVNGQTLYRYSPDGHRVEAGGVQHVIDPSGSLSRILMRKEGTSITYYIWGLGLEYEISAAATKTYHADHLGSTMLLTDGAGSPTGDYFEYDSYGNPTHRSGSSTTPFRWHGVLGVTTESNGLVHMRARFYHPRLMRFLNQDPIGFQGGLNWFAFVGNNPVGNVDPSGLINMSYDYQGTMTIPKGGLDGINQYPGIWVPAATVGAIPAAYVGVQASIAAAPTIGATAWSFLTQAPQMIAAEVALVGKTAQVVAQRAPELGRSVSQFGSAMNMASIEMQAAASAYAPRLSNGINLAYGALVTAAPDAPQILSGNRAVTIGQYAALGAQGMNISYNALESYLNSTPASHGFTPYSTMNSYGNMRGSVILSTMPPAPIGELILASPNSRSSCGK